MAEAMRRGRGARWVVLAAVLATAACSGTTAPPPTVRVDRGIVKASVSASGSLVAITQQKLGFTSGGQLAEVLVKVGDTVAPGQVLARIDAFALRQTLDQKQAALDQQQAALDKITNGNSVEAADATLKQAKEILDATQEQVDATKAADASATDRARKQLDFDRSVLDKAQAQLRADTAACGSAPSTPTSTATPPSSAMPAPHSSPLGLGHSSSTGGAEGGTTLTTNPACDRIAADKSAVQDAQRTVLTSATALDSAEQKENVDAASGRVSIENARQSVVTAQNNRDSAASDRPADTDTQAAMVRDAQSAVAVAQADLDNAVLRSPVAGVVSSINGTVGEVVGNASGTTAQAPGSDARLPGVADTSGAGSGAGASAGSAATSAGGGAFITLDDVDTFRLVVPFEESDASRLAANQRVDVTVDAVPGLTEPGTVLAVSPTGVQSSGIVNYYATVVLNQSDPRLRDGQTAEAAVVVDSAEGVLRVPSAAVRTEGGRTVVSTPGPNGAATTTPFGAGRVGDQYTEVQSGLKEGQEVLLPQAQVSASPPAGGPPR
jgi:HlyD family secretion protein